MMQPHFAFCNCFTRGTHSLTRLNIVHPRRGGGAAGRGRSLTPGPGQYTGAAAALC